MAKTESKKAQNVRVIKSEEKPETPAILAKAIVDISKGFNQLSSQGLTRRAIIVLLQGMPGCARLAQLDIDMVLDNLPKLAGYYLK